MGILSAFFTEWSIKNLTTGEVLKGDFEAEEVTKNVSSSYNEHYSLNARSPIIQYLHGNANTISFRGRFFWDPAVASLSGTFGAPAALRRLGDALGGSNFLGDTLGFAPLQTNNSTKSRFELRPAEKLKKLEDWTQTINRETGHPDIVLFSIGDELSQQSVIESISNIVFDAPFATGEVRGMSFTVNLREFVESPAIQEIVREDQGNSRYHHMKRGEYYELVAYREYKEPLLGDIVRSRNPNKPILSAGDVIRYPSHSGIRLEPAIPRSIPLKTLSRKKVTAQARLRNAMFSKYSSSKFSSVIPEGI